MKDPPRGQHDATRTAPRRYGSLLSNRPYVLAVSGYAAYTFALGGLGFWMPAFLERERGLPRTEATQVFGAIVMVTGFAGTFLGGWLGDKLLPRTKHAYLWVSGVATLLAAPLTFVALSSPSRPVVLTTVVIAEVLIFMCTGPVNSAILNAVSPFERAVAVGMSLLAIQFLGNIPAPVLIGFLSDRSSLAKGLLVVPVAILVSGIIWSYAAWRGEREA